MWDLDSRLYLAGEPVHSNSCGFGEVTVSGTKPVVRFLNGLELIVLSDDIRPISNDDYDRELINRWMIEAWLDWRVTGLAALQITPLRADQATTIVRLSRGFGLRFEMNAFAHSDIEKPSV